MIKKLDIADAYLFLRKENHSIPSETLDFMLEASMEKLSQMENKRVSSKLYEEVIDEETNTK